MNYKLAKQLKDAGFPQSFPSADKFYSADGILIETTRAKGNEWALSEFTSGYAFPTLEELIEACGDKFSSLLNEHGSWRVYGIKIGFSGLQITTKGATPTEAMANLYIASNDKRSPGME